MTLLNPITEGGARLHGWIGRGVDRTTPKIAEFGATLQAELWNYKEGKRWESYQVGRAIVWKRTSKPDLVRCA